MHYSLLAPMFTTLMIGLGVAALVVLLSLRGRLQRLEQHVAQADQHTMHLHAMFEGLRQSTHDANGANAAAAIAPQPQVSVPAEPPIETKPPIEAAPPTWIPPVPAAARVPHQPTTPAPVAYAPASAMPVPPGTFAPWGPASGPFVAPASATYAPAAFPGYVPAAPLPPKPQSGDFEQQLGARWAVWVGGVALALGAILLVRYSFQEGYFGPAMRVLLGAVLALVLAGAGEWLRGRNQSPQAGRHAVADIPSVLTAAGTVAAFGTVYSAHALYHFLAAGPAFALMGLIGIASMFAALRHGPSLAGLGLIASHAAPLLVSSENPSPWPVVAYLAAIALSGQLLARLRNARWISIATVAGAVLWGVILFTGEPFAPGIGPALLAAMAHTALQSLLLVGLAIVRPMPSSAAEARAGTIDGAFTGQLTALAVLAAVLIGIKPQLVPAWVGFATAITAILAFAGVARASAAAGSVLAGVTALAALAFWPDLGPAPAVGELAFRICERLLAAPANPAGYGVFALVAMLLIAGTAFWRLRDSVALPAAGCYLGAAALVPLAVLVVAYLRGTGFDRSLAFALLALGVATLMALASTLLDRTATTPAQPLDNLAAGVFAAAGIGAVSLALTFALDRGALTAGLSLAALGTAAIAIQRKLTLLRHVVAALGFVVLARLAWDPSIVGRQVGGWPVLNWLPAGYGIPALAFGAAAWLLRRERDDVAVRIADGLAVLLAALLVVFEIRHALHGGDLLAATSGHIEQGLLAVSGLGFAYVLARLDGALGNPVFRWAARVLIALSALLTVVSLGVIYNPLFWSEPVLGQPVASSLVIGYLLPAISAALVMRLLRARGAYGAALGAGALAVALLFGYVSLEVRHVFQGSPMNFTFTRRAGEAEVWAYSAAWLLFGLALLAYGIVRKYREARIASAAFVLLAVLKVFLLDLAGLSGIWRALSFIGLGFVLIGIGLVYQRLVLVKPAAQQPLPFPPMAPPPIPLRPAV